MRGNDLSLAVWRRVAQRLPVELHGYAREWALALEQLAADRSDRWAQLEWELWRELCTAMKEAGAVTEADLKSPLRVTSPTPGQQLLADLRTWGDFRVAIAKREATL